MVAVAITPPRSHDIELLAGKASSFYPDLERRMLSFVRLTEWLTAFEIQNRPETPFTLAKRRIFLHHICVNSDQRRNGTASALVKHIETFATEIGSEEIALDTWSSNEAAQSFFRASGFEPFRIFMRKQPVKAG